jgi:hypothetical protein
LYEGNHPVSSKESRTQRRHTFSDPIRVQLLEDDADTFEVSIYELEASIDRLRNEMRTELARIRNWFITGAITFAFSAVLLGINVAIQAFQGR